MLNQYGPSHWIGTPQIQTNNQQVNCKVRGPPPAQARENLVPPSPRGVNFGLLHCIGILKTSVFLFFVFEMVPGCRLSTKWAGRALVRGRVILLLSLVFVGMVLLICAVCSWMANCIEEMKIIAMIECWCWGSIRFLHSTQFFRQIFNFHCQRNDQNQCKGHSRKILRGGNLKFPMEGLGGGPFTSICGDLLSFPLVRRGPSDMCDCVIFFCWTMTLTPISVLANHGVCDCVIFLDPAGQQIVALSSRKPWPPFHH